MSFTQILHKNVLAINQSVKKYIETKTTERRKPQTNLRSAESVAQCDVMYASRDALLYTTFPRWPWPSLMRGMMPCVVRR